MLDVEQWAQIRRMHVVDGVSIKEIARRTGLARNTVRAALRSEKPPSYERDRRSSKLDPFREEIERLLRAEPRIPNTRIRELIAELGYEGGKTILDDHLREVRPQAHLPAHRLPPRGDLPVRPLGAQGRDPRWPRADPQRLGGDLRPGLLARRRRRPDLRQAGPRHPLGHG